MDKIGTRQRQNKLSATLRRPDYQTYNQNPGLTYTASTITFTNPNQINDSASGFAAAKFFVGQRINVKGSDVGTNGMGNDGDYTIASLTTAQILTVEQTIKTDSNTQTVTVFPS